MSQSSNDCLTERSNKEKDEEEENADDSTKNRPHTEMGLVVAQKLPEVFLLFNCFSGDERAFERDSFMNEMKIFTGNWDNCAQMHTKSQNKSTCCTLEDEDFKYI